MNKHLIAVLVLFMAILNASAQKQTYFSDKSIDSISISTMQGVQIGTSTSLNKISINGGEIGYFNELRLASSLSLILSGNIACSSKIIKSFTYNYDENGYIIGSNLNYTTAINLIVGAEPRWYFSYKNRYIKGRNTKLNTGFYFSLPVTLSTNPFIKEYPFRLNFFAAVSFGYRQAIANNFFVEPSVNLAGLPYSQSFNLAIKAAYTFK